MATYLNMGRYGDVCSFLPILKKEFDDTGEKPSLVISKDYADILGGVSYVDPIVYDGPFDDITGALEYLKTLSKSATATQVVGIPDVLVSQVYGKHYGPPIICDSFQQDAWRLAGKLDLWPSQPPLIFDKRDPKREKKLYCGIPKNKPWIVVSTGGYSAPFPYKELLMELLVNSLPQFHIVDLSEIKAEKFYDLLGIMDHPNTAHMILTDSGPLHLAYATQKPIHAIVANAPTMWHGPAWRPFYASYTRYNNFARDVMSILNLIRNPKPKPIYPDIVHVYQKMPWATGDEKRRNDLAAKTWEAIPCVDLGLDDNCFVRSSAEVIPQETRRIPMIKDILRLACVGRNDEAVLLLTNTDTCVANNLIQRLEGVLPAYCYRWDFKRIDEPLPYDRISAGEKYPGCDFFAMRVGWWRRNHHLFPDMVIGRHSWDRIMRELIKSAGGREIEDLIYHEWHPSLWEGTGLHTEPSNLRNCKLAREWLLERKMSMEELETLNYEGKFKRPDFSKLKT